MNHWVTSKHQGMSVMWTLGQLDSSELKRQTDEGGVKASPRP